MRNLHTPKNEDADEIIIAPQAQEHAGISQPALSQPEQAAEINTKKDHQRSHSHSTLSKAPSPATAVNSISAATRTARASHQFGRFMRVLPALFVLCSLRLIAPHPSIEIYRQSLLKKTMVFQNTASCPFQNATESLIINSENSWSINANAWVWRNDNHSEPLRIPKPKRRPAITERFDEATRNETTVVLYGSSHLRALYFHFVRLHRGEQLNVALEDKVRLVASGTIPFSIKCDPDKSGWKSGNYGVDLPNCGPPKSRVVEELGPGVAIGFKTFLHTPDADDLFLEFLRDNNLRHPTVLMFDIGVWGARGNRTGSNRTRQIMSYEQEIEYYLDWIYTSFPSSLKVFIRDTNTSEQERAIIEKYLRGVVMNDERSFIWRKDLLVKNKVRRIPCGHGCEGPLLHVMAIRFFKFLHTLSPSGCSSE